MIFSLRVSHQIPRLSSFLCIRSTFFCPTFPNGALAPYNFSAYRDMPTHSPAGCGALHLYSFSSSVRKVPRLHIKTRLRRRFTSCPACMPSVGKRADVSNGATSCIVKEHQLSRLPIHLGGKSIGRPKLPSCETNDKVSRRFE